MDAYSLAREAFYSGEHAFTGDRQVIKAIAFLVDTQYLKLEVFPIATHKEYLDLLHDLTPNKRADEASGGSPEHVALKLVCGMHFQKTYDVEVLYEHPFCGYYPDVMTSDEQIIAECGHTNNPEKMLTYFKQGGVKKCICVPYPDPDELQISAYSFTASDTIRDFLAFWEAEKLSELRKKLTESRRR